MAGTAVLSLDEVREQLTTRLGTLEEQMKPLEEEAEGIREMLGRGKRPAGRTSRRGTRTANGGNSRADQFLALVQRHPDGIKVAEAAEMMGIKQNYLYRVAPGLVDAKKIVKDGTVYKPV